MGIGLVIGTVLYSIAMFLLFQWVGNRAVGARDVEELDDDPVGAVVIPDRVPAEWVDDYRTEHGG